MTSEGRTQFHLELARLKDDMVHMAAMVTEGVSRVTEALLRGDVAAADQIVAGDDELDLFALETEERMIEVIARQAPVASDLRQVLVDLRMVMEIERSGDLVTNIAKAIPRLQGAELNPHLRGLIDQMREQAVNLFHKAIDSYVERDAKLAAIVDELDDRLDQIHVEYLEALFASFGTAAMTPQQGFQLAVIGRFYERIGDHAVNISERVHYMVTGQVPEHAGAERARARRSAEQQAQG
jgi:phosphate transport system protein